MRAVDIIMKKRDGKELAKAELEFLINSYVAGKIPDYQISAWAMAVFFNGMTPVETANLTELMVASGESIDLSLISGPFVDKHSTGGVGDKTSLILAPLAASLGIKVPMMSGRALGHTGGTLDKLESMPGFKTSLSVEEFKKIINRDGFAMCGQTKDIVPADRLLYALRDVSATVESIPLITASILSKKKAEGTEGLVLDVKFGSGAFMKEADQAEKLARSLVDTGKALGLKVSALLTDMDEPLGNMVGNFLEVEESLDCLEGKGPDDLMEVTLELAARMAVHGNKAKDSDEGRRLCEQTLATGRPLELFFQNIESQGANVKETLELRGKYRSPINAEIRSKREAYISRIDAWKIGSGSVNLGVGRNRTEDKVSPTAGLQLFAKRGDKVAAGDLLAKVWAADEAGLKAALPQLEEAYEYSDSPPLKKKLILKEIK